MRIALPLAAVALLACGAPPATTTSPTPTTPSVRALAVPAYPAGTRSYRLETITITEGGGERDSTTARAFVRLRLAPEQDGLTVHAVLDSLRGVAGVDGSGQGVELTFRLGARGQNVPVASDSLPCSPLHAALYLTALRLLPPLPDTLSSGARWNSSIRITSCRPGVSLVAAQSDRYSVPRNGFTPEQRQIRVVRESTTRLESAAVSSATGVRIRGEGTESATLTLEPGSWTVLAAESQERLRISVSGEGTSTNFTQRVTRTLELLR